MLGSFVHRSGPIAGTVTSGPRSTRSGSPIVHLSVLSKSSGLGRCAGSPCGAPPSAHRAILAISSSLGEMSFLNFWMPRSLSTNHGGITPARGPRPVRVLMARAQGRTCSKVMSGIGATPPGRWHCWQLRCRMGAMSLVNVTSVPPAAGAPCWALVTAGVKSRRAATPRPSRRVCIDVIAHDLQAKSYTRRVNSR